MRLNSGPHLCLWHRADLAARPLSVAIGRKAGMAELSQNDVHDPKPRFLPIEGAVLVPFEPTSPF